MLLVIAGPTPYHVGNAEAQVGEFACIGCLRLSFGCAVCSGLLHVLCGEVVLSAVGCCWLLLISTACLFSVVCLCFLLGAYDCIFALLLAMH